VALFDLILAIDQSVARSLNEWAALPSTFNRLVVFINANEFAKMAPFVFVAAWYWNTPPLPARRRLVISGLTGIFVAFFIGRILQTMLPFRERPFRDAALGLVLPHGVAADSLGGWSSFPSDHAAIFAAVVGLMFALSRPIGVLGLLYACLLVLAPRVYAGEHFLTDVLAGAAVGGAAAVIALRSPISRWLAVPFERLLAWHPPLFYALSLVFMAELIDMFDDFRKYASVLKGLIAGTF